MKMQLFFQVSLQDYNFYRLLFQLYPRQLKLLFLKKLLLPYYQYQLQNLQPLQPLVTYFPHQIVHFLFQLQLLLQTFQIIFFHLVYYSLTILYLLMLKLIIHQHLILLLTQHQSYLYQLQHQFLHILVFLSLQQECHHHHKQ